MVLFGAGGLIGFAIEGSNVRIPASYHGCIVGVTLALMGLVYHLLPRMGFAAVPVKAARAEQALRTTPEIAAMGLMGLGGLIAVVGGLMFLVIAIILPLALLTFWLLRAFGPPAGS